MVPICYEESLPNGCSFECADFVATALDFFMKSVVTSISSRITSSASNLSRASSIAAASTNHVASSIFNSVNGAQAKWNSDAGKKPFKRPLGIEDMRTAIEIGGWGELGPMPTIVQGIKTQYAEGVLEGWAYPSPSPSPSPSDHSGEEEVLRGGKRPMVRPAVNGLVNGDANGYQSEEEDEADWGWEGGGSADRRLLGDVLDDVLGGD